MHLLKGIEATPKWAGNVSLFQIHITADVGYALRQYLYATKDLDLLQNGKGLELALGIARYWKSRSHEKSSNVYEILSKSCFILSSVENRIILTSSFKQRGMYIGVSCRNILQQTKKYSSENFCLTKSLFCRCTFSLKIPFFTLSHLIA